MCWKMEQLIISIVQTQVQILHLSAIHLYQILRFEILEMHVLIDTCKIQIALQTLIVELFSNTKKNWDGVVSKVNMYVKCQ